jgi:hypothetical protein
VAQPDQPLSPLWWMKRLYAQLKKQRETFELFDAYYCGKAARLPWLAEQARSEFQRLLALSNSNYMGLVVDAMVERQIVEGFRIGKNLPADMPTWDIWQANNLDASSDQILLEAAIGGCSFVLVAPPDQDADYPLIYAEHPTQATVDYEPGSGRRKRAAGLKVWQDDWTGQQMATLYLPDAVYKFQAPAPKYGVTSIEPDWKPRTVPGERWPAPNPLGEVPLVEVANNPRMLSGGVSELADVIAIQDRVNKTLADRLVTQDFGAFPQKWAKGFPEFDADGNPNRIDIGRDRIVTSDIAETAFGQWDAAPLDPYSNAKREDVKDIASRTRTPAQYLLGEMSNVNGETLKASESGLVSKVRQRNRTSGEGLEAAVRLARKAAGLSDGTEQIETKWRNPEFRTEGELVDSLIKMATIGVPHEALWERWGASEIEIARWKQQAADQAALDPIGRLTQLDGQNQPDSVAGDPAAAQPIGQ